MSSRPVSQTVIYAQDTEPTDTRDGVIWVDTSVPERPASAYSSDTGQFEPMSPSNIAVQDSAPANPTLGDGWIDTSQDPPQFKTWDGAAWNRPVPHVECFRDTGEGRHTNEYYIQRSYSVAFDSLPAVTGVLSSQGQSSSTYGDTYIYSESLTSIEFRDENSYTRPFHIQAQEVGRW